MAHKKLLGQTLVIIAALLVPIVPFVIIGELPGDQWLNSADDNSLLFALTGSGLLALDILLPVPSSILGTLMGARLGFLPGALATATGLIAGNMAGYWLARFASGSLRSRLPEFPESTTLAAVFLTRPVPVVAEAMVLTAGATRMPVRHFFVASTGGNLIYAVVLAGNGAAFLPDALLGPGLLLPMLLPVAAWYLWRRR